jgi:oxygen-independent coproporphyrinogen-3 oxidase
MAGIYIHIPFCKKKCSYCDFYSNTNLGILKDLINAEVDELILRKDYLRQEDIDTVYFGGGTPSVLNHDQVEVLLKAVYDNFKVNDNSEITFECNPDDLTKEYLAGLKHLGINRISIGVQSFYDEALKFLGRRHSSDQAKNSVIQSIHEGFRNVSIDLIFGIPGVSFEKYKESLHQAIDLGIQHISAYQLTFEENTLLYKMLNSNTISEIDEEEVIKQFEYTINYLNSNGFYQYEVSNYAREGFMSRHNWLYWSNGLYLGVGPSAHSYDGEMRQWNTSSNMRYVQQVMSGVSHFTIEQLSEMDRFNEYILTGLRTSKGVSYNYIRKYFNEKISTHFIKVIKDFVDQSLINKIGETYTVSMKGINILDFIIRKLNYV